MRGQLRRRKHRAGVSRGRQHRVVDEVQPNPARQFPVLEVTAHRLAHVQLKLPQILALSGDAALTTRRVPGGSQPAALLVALDFKGDVARPLSLLFSARFHSLVFNLAQENWRVRQDLNLQPSDPKSEAL